MGNIKTAYGQLATPESPDDLIVRALTLYGEWSRAEQVLLSPLVRPQDRVWDVGAFLGTFGIGLTQMASRPPQSLLAVEPNPDILPYLKQNLSNNAPCAFQVAAFAAGGDNKPLKRRAETGSNNAGAISYQPATESADTVSCRTLKELRHTFGDYDVLKLDIEGMENAAIRSDIEYLQIQHPVIWAECNETPESILLLETLVWLQYEPLYVAFPAFLSANFNNSSEKIYPMAYEAALLAAPRERLVEFTGNVAGEDIIVRPVKSSYDLRRALWATPRWAMEEWTTMSRPELIGALGHVQTNDNLASFLNG